MLGFRGAAGVAQGAFGTAGVARRADQRAELHPRLVGCGGLVPQEQFVGEALGRAEHRGFRGEVRVVDEFRMRSRDWAARGAAVALAAVFIWIGR